MKARDRFVAERISLTLRDGETGVLFMGLAHLLQRHLPVDMRTDMVIPRPPSGKLALPAGKLAPPAGTDGGDAARTGDRKGSGRGDAGDHRG